MGRGQQSDMEDIEDIVGEPAGAPLGLHLPKKDPPSRSNNAVVIKPRRQRPSMMTSSSEVSTCVDGEADSAKVPGTQVILPATSCLYVC